MAERTGGGFGIHLGLKTDKNSFQEGIKQIDNTQNAVIKLVGTIKNAAPLLIAGTAGVVETAELKASKAIGIASNELASWKASAAAAGTSASSLVSEMTSLEQKMQGLKLGRVDTGLAQNLGFLNIGYGDFANMDATQRIKVVFEKAEGMEDQQKAALLIQNILGSASADYYRYLQLSGKSLDSQLIAAQKLVFTNDDNKKKAMLFNAEIKKLGGAAKEMAMLYGSELGGALTPLVGHINDIIGANREMIASGILGFVNKTAAGVRWIVDKLQTIEPVVSGVIDKLGGLDKVIVGVALGFTGLKIAKIVASFAQLAASAHLLKFALLGFVGVSIFNNLTPEQLDKLKEGFNNLKESFKSFSERMSGVKTDGLQNIVSILEALMKVVSDLLSANWDDLGEHIADLGKSAGDLGWTVGQATVAAVTGKKYADVHATGNKADQTAYKSKLENDSNFMTNIKAIATRLGLSDPGNVDYKKIYLSKLMTIAAFNEAQKNNKKLTFGDFITANKDNEDFKDYYNYGMGNFDALPKLQDGIISPNGRVAQVSPQDWIFAMKDPANFTRSLVGQQKKQDGIISPISPQVAKKDPADLTRALASQPKLATDNINNAISDLARMLSAFSAQTTNNSYASQNRYTIQQTFNISGQGAASLPATIKEQAYAGANRALQENIASANRYMQLMPATR